MAKGNSKKTEKEDFHDALKITTLLQNNNDNDDDDDDDKMMIIIIVMIVNHLKLRIVQN